MGTEEVTFDGSPLRSPNGPPFLANICKQTASRVIMVNNHQQLVNAYQKGRDGAEQGVSEDSNESYLHTMSLNRKTTTQLCGIADMRSLMLRIKAGCLRHVSFGRKKSMELLVPLS